jgi:hypothetical protein
MGIAMSMRTAMARPMRILGAREEENEVFTACLGSGGIWVLRFQLNCWRVCLNL